VTTRKKTPPVIEPQLPVAANSRIEFIKSAKFFGIGLDQATSSVNRLLLAQAREAESPLEIELTINQSVLEHENDYFVVAANFELTQRSKGSDEKIVSLAATFSAKFNLTKPANKELVDGFAALEARLIFFPYLRHFVSDMSYRMAIDIIVLPMTSELEN
jgi:hypothetical protein